MLGILVRERLDSGGVPGEKRNRSQWAGSNGQPENADGSQVPLHLLGDSPPEVPHTSPDQPSITHPCSACTRLDRKSCGDDLVRHLAADTRTTAQNRYFTRSAIQFPIAATPPFLTISQSLSDAGPLPSMVRYYALFQPASCHYCSESCKITL